MLDLKNITYRIAGRTLIDKSSLSIPDGHHVGLIGQNGAGKSTLLKLLVGLLAPTSGLLTKDPALVTAYVPQKLEINPLLPLTVEDFLDLTPKKALSTDEVLLWLEAGSLKKRLLKSLSEGQKQRILLAKALLRKPTLLVLDEPTQGLDIYHETLFYKVLNRLRDTFQTAIILSSHDLHMVFQESAEVICLDTEIGCMGVPKNVQTQAIYQNFCKSHQSCRLTPYVHSHLTETPPSDKM